MRVLPPGITFEFFPVEDIQKFYRTYLLRKVNKNLESRITLFLEKDWQRWNTLVLLYGVEIVGMSTFGVNGSVAEFSYTSVDKEYRGRGLGGFLIWKQIEIVSNMGLKHISVTPYSDMGRVSLAKNIWKYAGAKGITVEDDYFFRTPYDSSDEE